MNLVNTLTESNNKNISKMFDSRKVKYWHINCFKELVIFKLTLRKAELAMRVKTNYCNIDLKL